MSMGVSRRREWSCAAELDNVEESEKSSEVSGLWSERGEDGALSVARDEESGGVGGACGERAVVAGGVAGVSRAEGGEREKAEESEGERAGESCS